MLLPTLLSFAIGLSIILVASQAFLGTIKELAAKWNISPLILSVVVVALGTTLPEMTVTTVSLYKGDAGLAMANLIGSSITNIAFIFAVSVLIGKVKVGTVKSQKNAVLLLAVTVLFVGTLLSSMHHYTKSLIFFATVSGCLLYQYFMAKNARLHEDKNFLKSLQKIQKKRHKNATVFYSASLLFSVLGLAIGGLVTVNSVSTLATLLGYSTTILGLTLTAVSTSLPELVLTILASRNSENKVVLGTLLGSNIFNLTLYPGVILLTGTSGIVSNWELYSVLIITIFFSVLLFSYKGRIVPKKIGLALVIFYVLYLLQTLDIVLPF